MIHHSVLLIFIIVSEINTSLHDCKAEADGSEGTAQNSEQQLFDDAFVRLLLRQIIYDEE